MKWIALSEKDTGNHVLENRLSAAADQLRANSGLPKQWDPEEAVSGLALPFSFNPVNRH